MKLLDRLLYLYSLVLSLLLLGGSVAAGLSPKNLFLSLLFLPLPGILLYEGFKLHPIHLPPIRFKSLTQVKSPLFYITLLMYGSVIILVILKTLSSTQTFASPAPISAP